MTPPTEQIEGIAASGGIAVGPIVLLRHDQAEPTGEPRSLEDAVAKVVRHYAALADRAREEGRGEEAEVLEAYELLVTDPALQAAIEREQAIGDAPLDQAVMTAGNEQADELAALGDEYLAQRAEDLRAAVRDIVTAVRGGTLTVDLELPEDAIIVADELTPADTSTFDLDRVGGFAIARGGMTSHTAIVARSVGIPAVVGAIGVLEAVEGATTMLVDGDAGMVCIDPDDETRAAGEERAAVRQARRQAAAAWHGKEVRFDGERVLVAANIGTTAQLEAAVEGAADGVGLFRTEFLHLESDHPPDRESQAEIYREAARSFDDPVIVRTLDIGGDKESRWLELPREDNPFLGVRGLRLCLEQPEVLATQFEAILDVADGDLWVMLPMVARLDDVTRARALWDERVAASGRGPVPFGVMVETPAAALLARHLAKVVDFVSIGTNDLTQYTAAADRGLASLAQYHDPVAPPVLQLIRMTTDAAIAEDIHVGVCGGAAADPVAATLLLGMGVRELSVPPTEIDVMRSLVADIDPVAARRLAELAVLLPDAAAVREEVTSAISGLA